MDISLSSSWYSLGLVLVYLAILVLLAEATGRFVAKDVELTRKLVHIGSGNVILLAWWLNISTQVIIAAAIIAAAIAVSSYFLPILPSINSVGRKSLGTLFYAISIGVLATCFWHDSPEYAAIGILIMAWGDGMAALVGGQFGKHTYNVGEITKSWEGSLAMAVSAFLVCYLILLSVTGQSWQNWTVSFIVAVVATALESFSVLGIDNLTVPLGSAALCFWCVETILN